MVSVFLVSSRRTHGCSPGPRGPWDSRTLIVTACVLVQNPVRASSPSIALLRKLCLPPILLVKYLLLITYYPRGWLLSVFKVLWPDVWFSVFVSGVGLWCRKEWKMSPCPIIEKNNSLTEIPVNSGFFLAF